MGKRFRDTFLAAALILTGFVLGGCGAIGGNQNSLGTAAAETIVAQMTQMARMTSVAGTLAPIPVTGATETPVPTAMPTEPPAPTATPLPSNTPVPTIPACQDVAAFVRDVSVSPYDNFKPGAEINKVWRITNDGSCTWDTGYALVFSDGDQMDGPDRQTFRENVAPGKTVDLELDLQAPSRSGVYVGEWLLRNAAGTLFGLGSKGQTPLVVSIVVGPNDMTAPGGWQGEYFGNPNLNGAPALKRRDAVIDFKWLRDAPAPGLPKNRFSVRWTGSPEFKQGSYHFRVKADDGVRLWVDDVRLIDSWGMSDIRWEGATVALAAGEHEVKLEYKDDQGTARVYLDWERVDNPEFTDWKGRYYANSKLNGDPVLIRNDVSIDFDWGKKSPAVGVPQEDFSVRWTRRVDFAGGTYVFKAQANGGIRVKVDGDLVIDEWHPSDGSTVYEKSVDLSGSHDLTVEYFNRGKRSLAKFWWEPAP
jgi:hypothetical protein